MFKTFAAVRPAVAEIPLVPSGKSPAHSPASRLGQEGRFAIVTNVEPQTRWTYRIAARIRERTNNLDMDGEVVWSWPPGAEVKLAAFDEHASDRGKKADPWGERV